MKKSQRAIWRGKFFPSLELLEERALPSGLTGDLNAVGRVIFPNAGHQLSAPVAWFTDPDGSNPQGTLTATVDWGDGSTSAAQILPANETGSTGGDDTGAFKVDGTHTYASAGLYQYSVQVTDTDGDSATAHGRALVDTDHGDLEAAGKFVLAQAGQTFTGRVGFVTDLDPIASPGTISATIDWGDGTTSPTQVTAGEDGRFDITAMHTYAKAGHYQYALAVVDTDGDSDTVQGQALVTPEGGDLFAVGRAIHPSAAQEFSGKVAFFIDPDLANKQGTFSATIDWGDGSTSAGQVSTGVLGIDSVSGTHTYASAGKFSYTVQITDTDGDSDTAHGRALVDTAGNDLEAAGKLVLAQAGQMFDGRVAVVTDADPSNTQGTLSATIDWGDGSTSTAQVTDNSDGTFTVAGSHTYASAGAFHYTVQVADTDGDSDTAQGLALVGPAGGDLFAIGRAIRPNAGNSFSGKVATFVDPDLANMQGALSATIDWGDGSTSAGEITNHDGVFTVTGSHTYAATGIYSYSVKVSDTDGDADTAHGHALVDTDHGDLAALGRTLVAEAGSILDGRLALFTDPDASNSQTPQGTFTATIDWGDGTTSAGQVTTGDDDGVFRVSGTHTYAKAGRYHYSVQITDSDGDTDTAFGRVLVRAEDGALAAAGSGASATVFNVTGDGKLFWQQGGKWVQLGSFIQKITTATDGSGNPVVFAVTAGHDLFRFDAVHGWARLGAFIESVSASTDGGSPVVFVITSGHDLFRFDDGRGWGHLGSFIDSVSVAAGADGKAVVFAVTSGHDLFRLDGHGWGHLGSFIDSISSTSDANGNLVAFVVTSGHDLFRFDDGHGWGHLGSFIDSVSASTDKAGQSIVDVVTAAGDAFHNDGHGAWQALNPPEGVRGLLAATADRVFSLAADGTVFAFDAAHGWLSMGQPGK